MADGSPEKSDSDEGRIGFSEFVLSMATNAVMHLGGDGESGRVEGAVDLAAAAQHIDIIVMLKEKTEGNLNDKEAALLDALLYDLRMKYLEVAQSQEKD